MEQKPRPHEMTLTRCGYFEICLCLGMTFLGVAKLFVKPKINHGDSLKGGRKVKTVVFQSTTAFNRGMLNLRWPILMSSKEDR